MAEIGETARGKKIEVHVNTETVQENLGKKKKGKKWSFDVTLKEGYQEYAQVLRMLGDGLCEAMCSDAVKRLCHIEGNFSIDVGDIILVSPLDYEGDNAIADVILKYLPDDIRFLKGFEELPSFFQGI